MCCIASLAKVCKAFPGFLLLLVVLVGWLVWFSLKQEGKFTDVTVVPQRGEVECHRAALRCLTDMKSQHWWFLLGFPLQCIISLAFHSCSTAQTGAQLGWGAEQYCQEVLVNSGFQGTHAKESTFEDGAQAVTRAVTHAALHTVLLGRKHFCLLSRCL